jgi:hypothetical protein
MKYLQFIVFYLITYVTTSNTEKLKLHELLGKKISNCFRDIKSKFESIILQLKFTYSDTYHQKVYQNIDYVPPNRNRLYDDNSNNIAVQNKNNEIETRLEGLNQHIYSLYILDI